MDASRGVQQFNQMMSTGVVDLEAWKTLQETMPLALQKTAEAMGFTGKTAQRDLYSALKKGKITFDDFQNSLVKLGTGTGMLASLAKENSLGIATSFGNLANAIAKGMANILTKLDALTKKFTGKSIAQNIDSLKAGINSFFAAAVSGMDKLDALFSYIQKHGELFKTLAVGALAAVSALVAFRIAITTIAAVSGAAKTIGLVAFAFTNVRKEVGLAKAAMVAFNVATGANPLVFLITLLIGATAALAFFFTKTKTGQKIVQNAWGAIKSVVETTVNALKVALQATGAFFERVGVAIKAGFLRALEDSNSALSKFVSFCQQVGAALKSAFGSSIDFVVSLFYKLKESLGGATSGAISGIVTYTFPADAVKLGLYIDISRYTPGTGALEYGFRTIFIPREAMLENSGKAIWESMVGTDGAKKIFYATPTSIRGHADNGASPANGWCIRRVGYR
ncbi:tape measure protein [Listeria newyorkensis]|uniref:Tape measure protein n=2 Tax=Listeria newyorkensis TaxID=1497681 RepID=A0A841YTC4_9LIST|nr:tape measure protein [Listeria newyorkensis]